MFIFTRICCVSKIQICYVLKISTNTSADTKEIKQIVRCSLYEVNKNCVLILFIVWENQISWYFFRALKCMKCCTTSRFPYRGCSSLKKATFRYAIVQRLYRIRHMKCHMNDACQPSWKETIKRHLFNAQKLHFSWQNTHYV